MGQLRAQGIAWGLGQVLGVLCQADLCHLLCDLE